MDRFIRRENIKHYRELLKTVKEETERQRPEAPIRGATKAKRCGRQNRG
jgi:hypothetical protein